MAVRGPALPASAGTAARRHGPQARGCQIQRRPSSWLRSSSPAPRSLDRHLAPTTAPATHGDTSGNRTSAAFHALRPIAPASESAPAAAGGYRFRADKVVLRRSSHAPTAPSQAQEHRQGEVGNDRLRMQHHAALLPARCHSRRRQRRACLNGLALDRPDQLDPHRSAVNAQTGLPAVGEDPLGDLLIATDIDHCRALARRDPLGVQLEHRLQPGGRLLAQLDLDRQQLPVGEPPDEVRPVAAPSQLAPLTEPKLTPPIGSHQQLAWADHPATACGQPRRRPRTRLAVRPRHRSRPAS